VDLISLPEGEELYRLYEISYRVKSLIDTFVAAKRSLFDEKDLIGQTNFRDIRKEFFLVKFTDLLVDFAEF